ncbi:DfsB family protein, partial [Listeria monocytogenes]|nr:DfsB family protein [Listeria monocytogenes]
MRQYESKADLIQEITERYQKFRQEFVEIPEALRNQRTAGVDKTPSENLSYQIGWVSLLLSWEAQEQQGMSVHTPAEGYKWNNLGGLYQSFYQTYGSLTLAQQQELLDQKVTALCQW